MDFLLVGSSAQFITRKERSSEKSSSSVKEEERMAGPPKSRIFSWKKVRIWDDFRLDTYEYDIFKKVSKFYNTV